jgi:hypothetical protein
LSGVIPGIGSRRCNFCKFLTYASSIAIRSWKKSAISSLTDLAVLIRALTISTTCRGGSGSNASAYCVLESPRDRSGEASISSGAWDIGGLFEMGCTDRNKGGPLGNGLADGGMNMAVCV